MANNKLISIDRPNVDKLIGYVFSSLPDDEMDAIEAHLEINPYDEELVDSMLEMCAREKFSEQQMRTHFKKVRQIVEKEVKAALEGKPIALLTKKEMEGYRGGSVVMDFLERAFVVFTTPKRKWVFVRNVLSIAAVCMAVTIWANHHWVKSSLKGNGPDGDVTFFSLGGYGKDLSLYKLVEFGADGFSFRQLLFPFKEVEKGDPQFLETIKEVHKKFAVQCGYDGEGKDLQWVLLNWLKANEMTIAPDMGNPNFSLKKEMAIELLIDGCKYFNQQSTLGELSPESIDTMTISKKRTGQRQVTTIEITTKDTSKDTSSSEDGLFRDGAYYLYCYNL